jgi:hypothetical protein
LTGGTHVIRSGRNARANQSALFASQSPGFVIRSRHGGET